mmetsp:Transcript_66449/g.187198  ORF Transcript_66449/g.187198 Transcript_66449/m.187198 type:complete len:477 (-) Transcript_66449:1176-2606(-)
MFATISSSVSGRERPWKSLTAMMFSRSGCDAICSMIFSGACLVTGTHMRRARSRSRAAASYVRLALVGLPSVTTTTTLAAPSRPRGSSASAAARAAAVRVPPLGHSSVLILSATEWVSDVKWLTHSMLQSLCGSGPPVNLSQYQILFPEHLQYAGRSSGPLETCTARRTPASLPTIALANIAANVCAACQPSSPRLPLPSSSRTTSISDLHWSVGRPGPRTQAWLLHGLYCRLCGLVLFGHEPRPAAALVTGRSRWLSPPLHAFEHEDQLVHAPSTQSLSQDCALQASVSVVPSQRLPPCSGSANTVRLRTLTPSPHPALQAVHAPQSPSWQSAGHCTSLQALTLARGGQAAPYLPGYRTTARLSLCVPPPHVAEQPSATQGDTSQSRAASCSRRLSASCWSSASRTLSSAHAWVSRSFTLELHRCTDSPKDAWSSPYCRRLPRRYSSSSPCCATPTSRSARAVSSWARRSASWFS